LLTVNAGVVAGKEKMNETLVSCDSAALTSHCLFPA
jgi:hypothetical protein